ncbi:MAG: DUF4286 family protein [Rikenellaceae bacterium]
MYKVNTSFVVEGCENNRWLNIINENYIPFLKENGFNQVCLSRVLSAENESNFTYSLLVDIDNIADYEKLTGVIFDEYTAVAEPLFGARVVWFTTVMKVLNE